MTGEFAKEYLELRESLLGLAKDRLAETKCLIKELQINYYSLEELRELLDNWGDHEL